MSVIGIDFGNQNAVVAAAGRGGVDVILNGNSNRQNANMVAFGSCRTMGEAALSTATSNFRNTITNLKRLVGLPYSSPRAQQEIQRCPFQTCPISHPNSSIPTIGVRITYQSQEQVISIEHLVGMMIKHLCGIVSQKNADLKNDSSVNIYDTSSIYFPRDIVVTIPSYYNDTQRRAFLTGCAIAGITQVQRLLHESTATALAYGIFKDARKVFTKDNPQHVMFLDMGASSYSVTIVAFEPGKLIVKTSQHDGDLGGREFDEVVAKWLCDEFSQKYKNKLSGNPRENKKVWLKLLIAAEKAKKTLSPSGVKEARVNLECLMDDLDFNVRMTSKQFGELCEPLLLRLEPPITRALNESKVPLNDISSIEIVGGGTRVASVKRMFSKLLQLDENKPNYGLSTTLNADEAIARGAALQSAILSPRFKVLPYEIVEYAQKNIVVNWEGNCNTGMEVEGKVENSELDTNSVTMFERGSNFNVVRRVTLKRSGDVSVCVVAEGGDEREDLVQFMVNVPKGEEKKVRVNLKQDINGVISMCSAQMMEEVWEDEVVTINPPKQEEPPKEVNEATDESLGTKSDDSKPNEPTDNVEKNENVDMKVTPPQTRIEKRKKLKRTNLSFEESRPIQWSKPELDKAYELEVNMSNSDRIVQETADKRNELESYIYDMRDKIISESHLSPYASSNEKSTFSTLLETIENWLYEDGFDSTKSIYSEKCEQLHKHGDPIEHRRQQADLRPQAMSSLQSTIEHYQNWINTSSTQEQYSHITDEERNQCQEKCQEVSNWMYQQMESQGKLQLWDEPCVQVSELDGKRMELVRVVNPIMSKPIPLKEKDKPKVEEKKKGETENKDLETQPMETDEPKDNKNSDPMDTSV